MKTIKKVCFCLLLCLGGIGCSPSTSLDFWTITYDQIESYLNENGNLSDDWYIGLQGKDLAVDKDYPEIDDSSIRRSAGMCFKLSNGCKR